MGVVNKKDVEVMSDNYRYVQLLPWGFLWVCSTCNVVTGFGLRKWGLWRPRLDERRSRAARTRGKGVNYGPIAFAAENGRPVRASRGFAAGGEGRASGLFDDRRDDAGQNGLCTDDGRPASEEDSFTLAEDDVREGE